MVDVVGWTASLISAPGGGLDPLRAEAAKLLFGLLTPVVTIGGFYLAIRQLKNTGAQLALAKDTFEHNQTWKRKEFLANEIKSFHDDPNVRDFFRMMDYSGCSVFYKEHPDADDLKGVTVFHSSERPLDRWREGKPIAHLGYALRYHGDKTEGEFAPAEDHIRFLASRYIDWLDRFNSFIDSRLVDSKEIYVYLHYHLGLLGGQFDHATDFHKGFYEYLVSYHYDTTLKFIERFQPTAEVRRVIELARVEKRSAQSEGDQYSGDGIDQ